MDESAFVKVQVSSREVPAHHWSKKKEKKKFGCIEEGKRNGLTLNINPYSKAVQLKSKKDLSQPDNSPMGESESM